MLSFQMSTFFITLMNVTLDKIRQWMIMQWCITHTHNNVNLLAIDI